MENVTATGNGADYTGVVLTEYADIEMVDSTFSNNYPRSGHLSRNGLDRRPRRRSLAETCATLRVSRSGYYAWSGREKRPAVDLSLRTRNRAICARSRGTYGTPRVTRQLRNEGLVVNRKRVLRLMRQEGLSGVPKRKFRVQTARADPNAPKAANLLNRRFTAEAPDTVWGADITHLRTMNGWLYFAAVIDLYSRMVFGWAVEDHMEASLCITGWAGKKGRVSPAPPCPGGPASARG